MDNDDVSTFNSDGHHLNGRHEKTYKNIPKGNTD